MTSAGSWSSGPTCPWALPSIATQVTAGCGRSSTTAAGTGRWASTRNLRQNPGARRSGSTHAYLALLGPTDAEHHWRLVLEPGESFETVPVAIALSLDGFQGAVARLTKYRRAMRRPHEDHQILPVIFNDYLNTLKGNPTTDQLLPLIHAAAKVGVEYFCIDSGWYSEVGDTWWDTVGVWQPSRTRFPNGLTEVLDCIRAEGMIPGLWLEPEVVGVRSPIVNQLPSEAFFSRDGVRVVEQGRYHLDFSPPRVRAASRRRGRLPCRGSRRRIPQDGLQHQRRTRDRQRERERGCRDVGHNRAFLGWIDEILNRHPNLVLENCASGGMRTDYALLSRFQLQSTSDQSDFLRYPAIAAAAPTAIAPEQAGIWASPQPEWSDDKITFALSSALLCRLHLSGHIDEMSDPQQQLVGRDQRLQADQARPGSGSRSGHSGCRGGSIRGLLLGCGPSWRPMSSFGTASRSVARQRSPTGSMATRSCCRLRISATSSSSQRCCIRRLMKASWNGTAPRGELVMTLPDVPSARLVRLAPVRSQCS